MQPRTEGGCWGRCWAPRPLCVTSVLSLHQFSPLGEERSFPDVFIFLTLALNF